MRKNARICNVSLLQHVEMIVVVQYIETIMQERKLVVAKETSLRELRTEGCATGPGRLQVS